VLEENTQSAVLSRTTTQASTGVQGGAQPQVVRSTCPYCAVQCSFDLHVLDNKVVKVAPTPECPVALGTVCKKGLASLEDLSSPERLRQPLLRKNGLLEPVSWDEALSYVSSKFLELGCENPHAVGVFGGGSLTNEKVYLLGKFARLGLRTKNIDYNGRFCMSSAATALNMTFGLDRGLPFPVRDLEKADCILLFGANIAETLPPLMQFLKAAKKAGSSIYTLDPRQTVTSSMAKKHLFVRPGTDATFAGGLLHLLEKWGKLDSVALERVHGADAVLESVRSLTPEIVAEVCGIAEGDLLEVAEVYANAKCAVILSGRGAEQHINGTDTVQSLINLAMLAGHVGKAGGGYGTLTGQGNGQGGREHGQKADQLPGYRSIKNPQHRLEMAQFWNIPESELPEAGLSAQELLLECGKSVRALLVLGSNPVVSAPGSGAVLERLKALECLVVIDFFLSETAELADVVLPGSQWAEEGGTMTNFEGRVLLRSQALELEGGAFSDAEILCEIATRMGRGELFDYSSFDALQSEFFASTKGGIADYSGLSLERLLERSFQWPVTDASSEGTPYPYSFPFPTPDGKARLRAVAVPLEPDETALHFTSGRLSGQYQSGTQTRRNPKLSGALEVQIHFETAALYGLSSGDTVRLSSAEGTVMMPLVLSHKIRPDTLFAPFHWPESANLLVSSTRLDPFSRMPSFKYAPLTALEKVEHSQAMLEPDRLPDTVLLDAVLIAGD